MSSEPAREQRRGNASKARGATSESIFDGSFGPTGASADDDGRAGHEPFDLSPSARALRARRPVEPPPPPPAEVNAHDDVDSAQRTPAPVHARITDGELAAHYEAKAHAPPPRNATSAPEPPVLLNVASEPASPLDVARSSVGHVYGRSGHGHVRTVTVVRERAALPWVLWGMAASALLMFTFAMLFSVLNEQRALRDQRDERERAALSASAKQAPKRAVATASPEPGARESSRVPAPRRLAADTISTGAPIASPPPAVAPPRPASSSARVVAPAAVPTSSARVVAPAAVPTSSARVVAPAAVASAKVTHAASVAPSEPAQPIAAPTVAPTSSVEDSPPASHRIEQELP